MPPVGQKIEPLSTEDTERVTKQRGVIEQYLGDDAANLQKYQTAADWLKETMTKPLFLMVKLFSTEFLKKIIRNIHHQIINLSTLLTENIN